MYSSQPAWLNDALGGRGRSAAVAAAVPLLPPPALVQRVALLGQVGQVLGRRGCGGGGDVGGRQVSQVLPVADLNYMIM